MDAPLLAQAAALLHQLVTQLHPEPCSLDTIDTATHRVAHQAGRLAAELWAQAVVDVAEVNRPHCPCGATMHAERKGGRAVLLLLGLVRLRARRYRCPNCGAWLCPATQVLGLGPRARLTRAVRELLCGLGLAWSYCVAVRYVGLALPGTAVSAKLIERVTKQAGEDLARREDEAVAAAETAALAAAETGPEAATQPAAAPRGAVCQPARVYVSLDGILVRGRRAKEPLEVQVASLWSAWKVRTRCEPPRRVITEATFVARAAGWEQFGRWVWHEFAARGGRGGPDRETVVLGDGASGIRSLWEFYFPKALVLLDPWHLWERVKQRAREVLRDRQRALGAAQVVYERLRRGALAEAQELVEHWPAPTEWTAQQRTRLLAYLARNADIIRDYESLRERGYLVGSGLLRSPTSW